MHLVTVSQPVTPPVLVGFVLGITLIGCGIGSIGDALVPPASGAADQDRVIRVGPGRPLVRPSDAARVAKDGDVIEIDAGTYERNAAVWRQNNLTIRGVGGRALLKADGAQAEGKAIWVIKGKNTTVESVEFSGARVPDGNGAGIRQEGAGLTVRDCVFRDNENGILTGGNPESEVVVEFSEFDRNGSGDGKTHNMYIGHVRAFTLRGSYSHHARIGHNVKSRAARNMILYNRLADEDTGTTSYSVDLPNGGVSYLIGNVIQQGPRGENSTLVAYGAEGLDYPANGLYVVNNTVLNERPSGGRFLFVAESAPAAKIVNNIFAGPGTVLKGPGELSHNLISKALGLFGETRISDRLAPPPAAIDAGVEPGLGDGFALRPEGQYVYPTGLEPRPVRGVIDLGAYEARPVR